VGVRSCRSIAPVSGFAHATRRYWLSVFPYVRVELNFWRGHAQQIPDRALRWAALDALYTKSDVLEGAVVFAVFVPPPVRADVVRAIAAFEIAFDYLDNALEMPNPDPVLNGRSLCRALISMSEPGVAHSKYYEHHTARDDGGYLEALVNTCRATLAKLPSYSIVAEPVRRSLSRIVTYQSLNHGDAEGSHDAFREWARSQSVPGTGLRWWETGAAMGSQLSVLALIAAAADPTTRSERATAIEHAYFPWVGALSTLLDSVVDQRIDRIEAQRNLVDYYSSPQVAAERLRLMTVEATRRIRSLVDAEDHVLILAAMAAFFHSAPQATAPEVRLVTRAVIDAMGAWVTLPLLFLNARRALARSRPSYSEQRYSTFVGDRQ
jgi:tetraprenyl-beta-curcumene synthase